MWMFAMVFLTHMASTKVVMKQIVSLHFPMPVEYDGSAGHSPTEICGNEAGSTRQKYDTVGRAGPRNSAHD